jgi:choline dehydrogenase-like flavoprotein
LLKAGWQTQDRIWDVAIIGAGMGGGVLARGLADAGHDVLLIERGNEQLSEPGSDIASEDPEKRLTESRWPNRNTFEIDGVTSRQYAPIGSGVGGSANWYAAALERFEDIDLDSRRIRLVDGR